MDELDKALKELEISYMAQKEKNDKEANEISDSIRRAENYLRELKIKFSFRFKLDEFSYLLWDTDPLSKEYRLLFSQEIDGEEYKSIFLTTKLTTRYQYKDKIILFLTAFKMQIDKGIYSYKFD